MFENDILRGHFAETGDGLPLREIAWADLVARLAAVRDLRGEFAREAIAAGGDFARFPQMRASAECEGKHAVNHDVLADGKVDGATGEVEAANNAVEGDREI